MNLSQLHPPAGQKRNKKRIGRGMGSGHGKTSTRGSKGQHAGTGFSQKRGFEGGQMPLHRRLPKRGFKNLFRKTFQVVNVGRLQAAIAAGRLDPAGPIDGATLAAAGLVRNAAAPIRLLAKGELGTKLTITV